MDTMRAKTVTKLLLVIGMVCFIFPYVMVSCSGESVKATGVELMTCISFDDEKKFSEDDTPDGYLLAAFSLGVIGLGCAAMAKKGDQKIVISGCCATAGAISLLLFRTTFWERNGLTGYEGRVTVEFLWGWTLSLISYCGAAGCAFWHQFMDNKEERRMMGGRDSTSSTGISQDVFITADSASQKEEPNPYESGVLDFSVPTASQQATVTGQESPPTTVVRFTLSGIDSCISISDYPCLIGRESSTCDIVVEDSKVSRNHAQLFLKGRDVYIEDMGSSNGTQVNGQCINEPVEILSGDTVIIGTTQLELEVKIERST